MSEQGHIEDAIVLAKQRWSLLYPFDLEESVWLQLFSEHRPGDVLQAIKKTTSSRDRQPEALYRSLMYWIARLESERREMVIWPPPDVHQRN